MAKDGRHTRSDVQQNQPFERRGKWKGEPESRAEAEAEDASSPSLIREIFIKSSSAMCNKKNRDASPAKNGCLVHYHYYYTRHLRRRGDIMVFPGEDTG